MLQKEISELQVSTALGLPPASLFIRDHVCIYVQIKVVCLTPISPIKPWLAVLDEST